MWLDIIKMLVTIAQHKKEVNISERERISKMYSQMSELLVDAVKDLTNDVYPPGEVCCNVGAFSKCSHLS